MDMYRKYTRSTEFCMMGLTAHVGCRNRGATVDFRLSTLIRESLMLGSTVFLTSSLSQVDVVDELELDYSANRVKEPLNRDVQTTKCAMKEQYNAPDFDGNFEFDDPSCVLRATFLRSITLNLRVSAVRNFQIGIPIEKIHDILVRIGLPLNSDYVSYKRFKDERQVRSTMNITRLDGTGGSEEQSSPYSTARVSVDSHLVYAGGADRQIKITDLSRQWSWDHDDPDFSIALTPLARQGGLCLDESDGGFDVRADLLYSGSKCGELVGRAATGRCDRIRASKYTTWSGWRRVDISIQKAEMVISLEQHSRCADLIAGLNRERLAKNVPEKIRTFVLGLEFEVACTKGLNGSEGMDCVYGMATVRRWNEKWKVNKSKRKQSLAIIPLRSSASWISLELIGGDPAANARLIGSTQAVLRNSFPELSVFSNRIAYRGRVLGAYAASATLPVLGIISAQTHDSHLELYYHKPTDVTVIHIEYIAGLLTLISLCAIMACWVTIRFFQENAISRKCGYWIKVPTNKSEWVAAASQSAAAAPNETFANKEKEPRKVQRGYASTYEWAVETKQKLVENSMCT
ncbi:hypothetical protein NDN08_007015 [Rhodosorus marinus]|nr:hypothetical protein NDN08_007015 [Rhodosorus marinus]